MSSKTLAMPEELVTPIGRSTSSCRRARRCERRREPGRNPGMRGRTPGLPGRAVRSMGFGPAKGVSRKPPAVIARPGRSGDAGPRVAVDARRVRTRADRQVQVPSRGQRVYFGHFRSAHPACPVNDRPVTLSGQ
jgi:hypothetical protein